MECGGVNRPVPLMTTGIMFGKLSRKIRPLGRKMRRFYTLGASLGIGQKAGCAALASAPLARQRRAAGAARQHHRLALQVAQCLGQLEVVGAAVIERLALARSVQ